MLFAEKAKSTKIDRVEEQIDGLVLYSEKGMYRLIPIDEAIIRITYTEKSVFSNRIKPGIIMKPTKVQWRYKLSEDKLIFETAKIKSVINTSTASFTYYDHDGKLLLKERDRESKILEEFQSYKLAENQTAKTQTVETADGVKELVVEASKVPDEKLYHTRLHLVWQKDEALYGLGQQEEGLLNLRGNTVYVHQANRKIAVPMLLSTAGYGILMDTYSPMIFNDTVYGSYLYTEADDELDYYFIEGETLGEVVKGYRKLTGKAALLPKWAFGYLQSQERYETAEEIEEVVKEYRKREIGLDGIILDWCSWEDGMWGQKSFDPKRFPDPNKMTQNLHEENVAFMISIWPNMDEKTENYKEMKENNALLPASSIYNALDEKCRTLYWEQVKRGLYRYGVDAWWCDSSEPITIEWSHKERMEPSLMYAEYCKELQNHLPTWATNAFPLYHAQTLYEGQRSEKSKKRVCNLTRSAYTGQQRYGTILWSGDTSASWETLRKQIAAGLNFVASGLPYWTVDIGAFFVKKSNFWYWDGDYDTTIEDAGYLELFTRWYQWGAFLPIFRGHGTDCRRELWLYRGQDDIFYNAILKVNRLRYQLMPYIYSEAGKVWLEDESMIKMLAFDFQDDQNVRDLKDQYMFGSYIMVCPVTEPMYFESGNKKVQNASYKKRVYLPKGCGWYDYWSEAYYEGGQWVEVDAPIQTIPLFVKEGAILPTTEVTSHVMIKQKIEWIVYSGKDSEYRLYEDNGEDYAYEKGDYQYRRFYWSQKEKSLRDDEGKEIAVRVVSKEKGSITRNEKKE